LDLRERGGQLFERERPSPFEKEAESDLERERLNQFSEMKVIESVLKVTEVFSLD